MSRSTVSKSDLAKVREFLQDLGVKLSEVTVKPGGEVKITLATGEDLTLPKDLAAIAREKNRVGQYGKHNKAA